MGPEEVARRKAEALEHIKFCVKLYRIQQANGRYFLHEHPRSASSWHEEVVTKLCRDAGVYVTVADQCRYGLTSIGPEGKGPAQKPTKFMTNSPCIAKELSRRCPNRMTHSAKAHKHVHLMNGRAKAAQEYPSALCSRLG